MTYENLSKQAQPKKILDALKKVKDIKEGKKELKKGKVNLVAVAQRLAKLQVDGEQKEEERGEENNKNKE